MVVLRTSMSDDTLKGVADLQLPNADQCKLKSSKSACVRRERWEIKIQL